MEQNGNNFNKNKYWKLFRLILLIPVIIFIIGICLMSNNTVNKNVSVGLMIGGAILFAICSLILSIFKFAGLVKSAKKYNEYVDINSLDEKEEERLLKEAINSTSKNRELRNFRSMSLYLKAVKDAPRDTSPMAYFNLAVIVLFIACCIGFVAFSLSGLILIGFICLGVAFLSIIFLLLYHIIHKKMSNSPKNIDFSSISQATVISCTISDEGSMSMGATYNNTTKILSTTYLVYLDVCGEKKKAYSKTFYNKGDKVAVYMNKKLKDMVKIDER